MSEKEKETDDQDTSPGEAPTGETPQPETPDSTAQAEPATASRPASPLAAKVAAAQLEAIAEPRTNPAENPPPVPARGGGGAIAWLALLLVLGLAAASVWQLLEQQKREALLAQRLASLESSAGHGDEARREIRDLDRQLREIETRWQAELRAERDSLEQELALQSRRQRESLQEFEASLAQQRAELARFSANDRDSWLLAEAEYLLRLANQRLVMAGDAGSALALISSADNILKELDDPDLYPARQAVAEDLAAVRAVPRLDIEGTYVAISALIRQADELVIFEMPEQEVQQEAVPDDSWQGRLVQGYEAGLNKLSNYLVIRRRDVPVEALMDPQWEGLVRQNLRMLLEQAQVALLSGNQALYEASLERAGYWVAEFFESDGAAAQALVSEIDRLRSRQVSVRLPDLTGALQALGQAIQSRLAQGRPEQGRPDQGGAG